MKWLYWLKIVTIAYLVIGLMVAFLFLATSGFDVDWTWDNLRIFMSIILLWPLWVWFMVVMWLSYRGR